MLQLHFLETNSRHKLSLSDIDIHVAMDLQIDIIDYEVVLAEPLLDQLDYLGQPVEEGQMRQQLLQVVRDVFGTVCKDERLCFVDVEEDQQGF